MKRAIPLVFGLIIAVSPVMMSQQPPAATPTALPSPDPREPSWAFQVQAGSLPAEDATPKSVPGSTKQYTPAQIDDLRNPPDWFPDEHSVPPTRVVKGEANAMACGACHLMNGEGHPESGTISGFTADYIVQQMTDFRRDTRGDFAKRMPLIAKALTEQDIRSLAPGLSTEDIAKALAILNRRPVATRDAGNVVKALTEPLKRDRDGLTAAMRTVNAFADERGLPIPFPPQ